MGDGAVCDREFLPAHWIAGNGRRWGYLGVFIWAGRCHSDGDGVLEPCYKREQYSCVLGCLRVTAYSLSLPAGGVPGGGPAMDLETSPYNSTCVTEVCV